MPSKLDKGTLKLFKQLDRSWDQLCKSRVLLFEDEKHIPQAKANCKAAGKVIAAVRAQIIKKALARKAAPVPPATREPRSK